MGKYQKSIYKKIKKNKIFIKKLRDKNVQFSKAYIIFRNQEDMKMFTSNYN